MLVIGQEDVLEIDQEDVTDRPGECRRDKMS